jgi:hypothetical protein
VEILVENMALPCSLKDPEHVESSMLFCILVKISDWGGLLNDCWLADVDLKYITNSAVQVTMAMVVKAVGHVAKEMVLMLGEESII